MSKETPHKVDSNLLPYLLLAFTNLFWSLNFIIGKLVSGVMPPTTISFFRWLPPALFFFALNYKQIRNNTQLIRKNIPLLLALGLTGYAINSICVYEAVFYTSTINTSFINAFNPVLIALAGLMMYRYPITRKQVLGFFLSLVGVVTIIFKGKLERILQLHINIGDLFMVGSISFWAIHTILYKKKGAASGLPSQVLFTMMMCCGVVLTIPFVIVENSSFGWEWIYSIQLQHIFGVLALNIFPSVLAYTFWNQALTRVSANEVAISQYLIPVFTTLISVSFLGEQIKNFHLWGGGFIFLGVFLVTMAKPKER